MQIDPESASDWLRRAAAAARDAAGRLARLPAEVRNAALRAAAAALRAQSAAVVAANARDLAAFDAAGGSAAFRDRLALTPARIEAMARGLEDIAGLPDPLGRVLAEWTRPNGLRIRRVAQPVGVIGMIYESRPNVGADAAGLCLKAGSAVLLRGGSDSFHSAASIHAAMTAGLRAAGAPEDAVQLAAGDRPRLCRRHAGRRGADRPDRAARRQGAGDPRAGRGAGAGAGACRGALPHLCSRSRRPRHGATDRGECEDAAHRHLRRHRDPADRRRHRPCPAARAGGRVARARLRFPRRRAGPRHPARACRKPAPPISTPNGWTRCCRWPWSTGWRRRWRMCAGTAASIPTPS